MPDRSSHLKTLSIRRLGQRDRLPWNEARTRRPTPLRGSYSRARPRDVAPEIAGGRRLGEQSPHVRLGTPQRLEHEDLLERSFLEVEDHRVPGSRDDLFRVALQAHPAE